jgi:hypothetical protein
MGVLDASAQDACPRCGKAFHCGVADPAPCPCAGVTLNPELRAELRLQFNGCLCVACLNELQSRLEAS